MIVDEQYLKWYAVEISGEPTEIPLNGYEAPGSHMISIDDMDDTNLSIQYSDEYPVNVRPSDIKEGSDKRSTLVIIKRGFDVVGTVGYRFEGLIRDYHLREWYRNNFEVNEIVLTEPEPIEAEEDGSE